MFNQLTSSFGKIFDKLKSRGALTESQIDESLRDIRLALIEADVALPVIRDFIDRTRQRAIGQEVIKSVSPGQMIIKIINDELITTLSVQPDEEELNLKTQAPASILIAGLQGSGKTTATGKLAYLLAKQNKKILLTSLDIYRPAAQEQLEIVAKSIKVDSLEIIKGQTPDQIIARSMKFAKEGGYDVVLYDTAGRLHIDKEMIDEVTNIKSLINPVETLLVIDSLIGQDAINIASTFNEKLDITGMILTRVDGDGRGGAALSARSVTGKPIKFLSTGEKPSEFEKFDAKRIANRILDMGDVVSLVEKAESLMDEKEAKLATAKLKSGKFDLTDYIKQLKMIQKMGGIGSMMSMLPGIGKLTGKLKNKMPNDNFLVVQEAIYLSMTKKERKNPSLLNASRRKRIALGSGTSINDVNNLMKQYLQISKMMKKASKMDLQNLMRGGIGKLFS